MKEDYKIIGEFDCNGEHLYVVVVNGNAHVIGARELRTRNKRLNMEILRKSA